MIDLATRIGQLMERNGWSVYKLSNESGIKDSTIYSILDNKNANPKYFTLVKIAEAFEMTLEELFKDDIQNSDSFLVARKYDKLSKTSKEIIDFLLQKLD